MKKYAIMVNGHPYPVSNPAFVMAENARAAVSVYIDQRWNGWPPSSAPYNISAKSVAA